MKLLLSLRERQIVRPYSAKKQINTDFVIKAMKCHKDDKHDVKGLDSEMEVPPFACSFHNSLLQGHMLSVADEEGGVCLYDTRKSGISSKLKGWTAHCNAIFDIAWVGNETKLVTASGDQTARLWDIQRTENLAVFKGHSCSLKTVDFQHQNLFVFATGARDGNIMIWDIRCNKRDGYYKPVNTIHNCHTTSTKSNITPQRCRKRGRRTSNVHKVHLDSQQSVTSVIFQDVNTLISAGAVDGNIKVWDLRKNYSTLTTEPLPSQIFSHFSQSTRTHGFSSLTLDSTKSRLFANCTNDVIYMYDCVAFQKNPLATFRGHSNATFYIKSSVSPDNQYLLSGSGDFDAYIWRIGEPRADPFHLTGHSNEVTCVAWCSGDQSKIVTCSDDDSFRIWNVKYGDKDSGDFVGWCERQSNRSLAKVEDTAQKSVIPLKSSSTSSAKSPLPSSPKPFESHTKCNSPQQLLHNWLLTNENESESGLGSCRSNSKDTEKKKDVEEKSHKRSCEVDCSLDSNKRVCIRNKTRDHSSNISSSQNESFSECDDINISNKENHKPIQNSPSKMPKTLQEDEVDTKNQILSMPLETNQPMKKSNWLRDMGVKKRCIRKPIITTSPFSTPATLPENDMLAALKNTRSIKDYCIPLTHDVSRNRCSR